MGITLRKFDDHLKPAVAHGKVSAETADAVLHREQFLKRSRR